MFVRVKSTSNSPRQSIQIVRHVGIAMDDDELAQLKILAEVIKAKIEAQHKPGLFSPKTVAKQMIEAKAAKAKSSKAALNVDLRQMMDRITDMRLSSVWLNVIISSAITLLKKSKGDITALG